MAKKEEKNFKCEICEKTFSSQQYQNQHISRVHGEVGQFICNVCSRTFGSQMALKLHISNYHK